MDKSALPVTRLNFGRILNQPASGRYTLSRLECFGSELPQHSLRPPTSCEDLWRAGHTMSGFYSVKHLTDIKTVFCDMSQVPGKGKSISAFASLEQQVKIPICKRCKNEFLKISLFHL